MPNKRIFQVQGLVTNTVAIGGVATLGINAAYQDIIRSTPDGAIGVEDVDKAGLRAAAALNCMDVTKVNAILDSVPGLTVFYGQESGTTKFAKYEIDEASPPGGVIVWHGMNLSFNKSADGVLQINGTVRFVDSATNLESLIQITDAQAAPVLTYPARMYQPQTARFDPSLGGSFTPLHVQSIQMSLAAVLLQDYGDNDVGETAVDIAGWNDMQVTMVHRDRTLAGAAPAGDVSAQMVGAGAGTLTLTLLGRAGGSALVLTVNALEWTGVNEAHGPGYTDFTMTGTARWRDNATGGGATVYSINGADKLFSIV